MLTSEDLHGGIGHQLDGFVARIPDANPLKDKLKDVAFLGSYATSYRYATAEGNIKKPPSGEQFDKFVKKVDELLIDLAKRFKVDLDQTNLPAGKPDPIR